MWIKFWLMISITYNFLYIPISRLFFKFFQILFVFWTCIFVINFCQMSVDSFPCFHFFRSILNSWYGLPPKIFLECSKYLGRFENSIDFDNNNNILLVAHSYFGKHFSSFSIFGILETRMISIQIPGSGSIMINLLKVIQIRDFPEDNSNGSGQVGSGWYPNWLYLTKTDSTWLDRTQPDST